MKLVIVGAAGFLGGAIYNLAKERGIAALGTSRRAGGGFLGFDLAADSPKLFLDGIADFWLPGEDKALVIAAAMTKRQDCDENPALAYEANVAGPQRLLLECAGRGIKTLCFSSDAVFDGKPGHTPYGETVASGGCYVHSEGTENIKPSWKSSSKRKSRTGWFFVCPN